MNARRDGDLGGDASCHLTIIILIFDEEDRIRPLIDRVFAVLKRLDLTFEVITDFGRTAAMMAGIDHSRGNILEAFVSEFSLVPVPANHECVALLKSLRISGHDPEMVDLGYGDSIAVPDFIDAVAIAVRQVAREEIEATVLDDEELDLETMSPRQLCELAQYAARQMSPALVRDTRGPSRCSADGRRWRWCSATPTSARTTSRLPWSD